MVSKFTFLAGFAATALLQADSLYLRNGRTLNGTFLGGNSREVRFLEEGGRTQRYSITAVRSVTFGATESPAVRSSGVYQDPQAGTRARAADAADMVAPAGTVVTVRMIDAIDSDATDAGKTYRGTLDEPLVVEGRTIAPKGADAMVRVAKVEKGGIFETEEVTLELAEIRSAGRVLQVTSNPAEVAAKSRGKETTVVMGGTAVVGAIIGAIAGGGKGAAIGAATGAGAGAAIQAIRGQRVKVASESTLDFTLKEPIYAR
ncbi:MAG: hypothetical protein HYZ57_14895 [Acidobacteria bacterium]|nr:hypothetical protein [Acidobacteriota bacterium]MBI3281119.1 hypothetical protein [Acidobacteriota bacterium]